MDIDKSEKMDESIFKAPEESMTEKSFANQQTEFIDYKKKADEYWDQLLRLQAEFSNYRKRSEKEKIDAIVYGKEMIFERMISLLDIMEQALKHSQTATDLNMMKQGFKMVVDEFLKFLKSEGIEPIQVVGENFDPHFHEALEQIEIEDEKNNNKVIDEIQKGYFFNGRLFRAAKVRVGKNKKEDLIENSKEISNESETK